MGNPIPQIIGGLIAGLVAGLIGYIVDMAIGAIINAFGSIIPSLILFGAIYGLISFFAGVGDAVVGGLFFSFGVILAGWALNDTVTFVGGLIAFVAVLIGLSQGHSSGINQNK